MTLSKRLLRWIDPKQEAKRQEFRMCLNRNMANAEDLTRTVQKMNGSFHKKLEGMKAR